ncbi:MAG: hypothetical protein V5A44_01630 [Haloarculaceae archaeon]
MTTVAVLADPPAETDALVGLEERGVLTAAQTRELYTATLRDACVAVENSGGDLLVNYRSRDESEDAAEEAVRSALSPALSDPGGARYEVQVGSTRSARVGNTVTHLLEREGVRSAAVVDPTVALLERRHVDSAAMKLRGSEVVVGPTAGGAVWYAGFTEPVDFTDALAAPSLRTLTERATDEGLDVDFLESLPLVADPDGLAAAVVLAGSRERAGVPVPEHTREAVAETGLGVEQQEDGLGVTTGNTDRS